jgi:hypothetical protein
MQVLKLSYDMRGITRVYYIITWEPDNYYTE